MLLLLIVLTLKLLLKEFEQKTPTLKKRINSINSLQKLGWQIGLRFDPLINYSKNKLIYKNFFNYIFSKIQVEKIHSVTTGHFRMPNNFFNKLVNIRPEDSLIFNKLKNEKLLECQTQKKSVRKN